MCAYVFAAQVPKELQKLVREIPHFPTQAFDVSIEELLGGGRPPHFEVCPNFSLYGIRLFNLARR